MATKIIFTEFDQKSRLYVKSFGFEENSADAHWGRGSRRDYIVHYVVSGEGFFNSHKVKSGQGFLITPHMMHEYHSSTERPWKYFWIIFSGEDGGEICRKYVKTDANYVFDFTSFELQIKDLIDRIMRSENPLVQTEAMAYFYSLLSCHERKTELCGNRHVLLAEKYMKTHIYRQLAITELSEALGISDRYLYNLFMKHRGLSPKQYMNRLKIDRAKALLKTTDDTISEIAASLGFYDVLTFSRFFKNQVGTSPTGFRRGRFLHDSNFSYKA